MRTTIAGLMVCALAWGCDGEPSDVVQVPPEVDAEVDAMVTDGSVPDVEEADAVVEDLAPFALDVAWGSDTLIVRIGEGAADAAGELRFFAETSDDGEVFDAAFEAGPWTPIREDRRLHMVWWPAERREIVRVRATLDGDEIGRWTRSPDTVPLTNGECDGAGFENWCGGRQACFVDGGVRIGIPGQLLALSEPMSGRCHPVTITAWHAGEPDQPVILVDARSSADPEARLPSIGVTSAEGFEFADLRSMSDDDGWRTFGYLRAEHPETLDVYVGIHGHQPVIVRDRPVRARGEDCDGARLVDLCGEGAACGPDDTCRTIEAPTIDRAEASLGPDGAVGVSFAGRDAQDDVRTVHVEIRGESGPLFRTRVRLPDAGHPNRFFDVATSGHLGQADGQVEGFVSVRDRRIEARPTHVRIALEDAERLIGETVEVRLADAAPIAAEVGAPCDILGVTSTCAPGAFCDLPDGESGSARCIEPGEACPFEMPVLVDRFAGDNGPAPDITEASCTFSRGNLGSEQGHVFTADEAGTYRFAAEGTYNAAVTLFARRYCDLRRAGDSELSCVHQEDDPESEVVSMALELEQGETVYVFVEAWWAGGGPYVLSVDGPAAQ